MTSPRTSSTIAAPRIVLPSTLLTLPISFSTRALIPTLVAQSVAPMKISSQNENPGKSVRTVKKPKRKGAATPRSATRSALLPTRINSGAVLSTPTSNMSRMTPSSARVSMLGSCSMISKRSVPRSPMLPRTTPAKSSPRTTGRRSFRAPRPPSLAAVRTRESSKRRTTNECGCMSSPDVQCFECVGFRMTSGRKLLRSKD